MKRRIKIIVVCTIVLAGSTFSQEYLTPFLIKKTLMVNEPQAAPASLFELKRLVSFSNTGLIKGAGLSGLILPDHYTRSFGFFCQRELQLEKTTKIPFRFRLGSLEYCNRLEGKLH